MGKPRITLEEIQSLDRLETLIAAGADVNRRCTTHFTPLGLAARYALSAQCRLLLGAGADPDFCSSQGASPLSELLGNPVGGVVASERIREVAEILLRAGASPEGNVNACVKRQCWDVPIFQAVQFGHSEIIPMLAGRGADLDQVITNQRSKTTPLSEAIHWKKTEVALSLLRSGAHAVTEGSSGTQLLRSAAAYDQTPVIECLIRELHVDPNEFIDSHVTNSVFPSAALRETMRAAWAAVQSEKVEEVVLEAVSDSCLQHSTLARRREVGLAI